jgi:hypothetical protein
MSTFLLEVSRMPRCVHVDYPLEYTSYHGSEVKEGARCPTNQCLFNDFTWQKVDNLSVRAIV